MSLASALPAFKEAMGAIINQTTHPDIDPSELETLNNQNRQFSDLMCDVFYNWLIQAQVDPGTFSNSGGPVTGTGSLS